MRPEEILPDERFERFGIVKDNVVLRYQSEVTPLHAARGERIKVRDNVAIHATRL